MKSVDRIKEDIESLREKLFRLIQSKENLLDPEVIKASILLDNALDEYNNSMISSYRR
ncbi:MAG TPA: aspartyl-phosphate phosphatase Spo0E family protein [Patescibacteria group bacterium]|jgi:hypothetical protein|nr:aspartyl-phosphate phosphatase Spo0E family protein [Patescibacteria group bacterium]